MSTFIPFFAHTHFFFLESVQFFRPKLRGILSVSVGFPFDRHAHVFQLIDF